MGDPLLFRVDGQTATPAEPLSLAEAGLTERGHLQEWVLANPAILGSDTLVLTFEFHYWAGADGARERDRLDVLGIDSSGQLVVVELKRDRAPASTDTQAIRYAALASRFTPDTLAAAHARFLTGQGSHTEPDEALRLIEDHSDGELSVEQLRRPRIVLMAAEFPPSLTASAVWLSEMGVSVELVQYRAYRAGDETVLAVSRLWPVTDPKELTPEPELLDTTSPARPATSRRRGESAVKRLVDAGEPADGTELRLRPTSEVDAEARDQVTAWIADDPARGVALWRADSSAPLEWRADGQRYTPTGLVRRILNEAADLDRGPRGTTWWVTDDGDDLVALADTVAPTDAAAASRYRPRDWSDLHAALAALEPGQWTSYGDLAGLIGSSARAVGQHVTTDCADCATAYRVLNNHGTPSEGFRWSDPTDTRSAQQVLEAEGVRFDDRDRADPAQRVGVDELRARLRSS